MDTKKFLLSALVGIIGLLVSGWLLEGLIFKNYLENTFYQPMGVSSEGVILWPLLVVIILMALIMAYIYPMGYEGGSPFAEGLRFGILLGLFSAIPFGFFFFQMFHVGFGVTLVMILLYTLEVTTSGVLIGLTYGRVKSSE